MRFEERELKPYAEPVPANMLELGAVYLPSPLSMKR